MMKASITYLGLPATLPLTASWRSLLRVTQALNIVRRVAAGPVIFQKTTLRPEEIANYSLALDHGLTGAALLLSHTHVPEDRIGETPVVFGRVEA